MENIPKKPTGWVIGWFLNQQNLWRNLTGLSDESVRWATSTHPLVSKLISSRLGRSQLKMSVIRLSSVIMECAKCAKYIQIWSNMIKYANFEKESDRNRAEKERQRLCRFCATRHVFHLLRQHLYLHALCLHLCLGQSQIKSKSMSTARQILQILQVHTKKAQRPPCQALWSCISIRHSRRADACNSWV